ncbi:hypothetical protein RB4719 [Rhodopirellula baltica SH 1]|uniref:Uncharacterized protein n=1 Tax=Rhodopirellula baltica (strain DSM 10527 / NCIMB 13988 / SH1) TaxID=243090 RepID=Q7US45_RHOBA|nr:hypothetical protein RB4719 [Rhodopirellula baltica SH 1]
MRLKSKASSRCIPRMKTACKQKKTNRQTDQRNFSANPRFIVTTSIAVRHFVRLC